MRTEARPFISTLKFKTLSLIISSRQLRCGSGRLVNHPTSTIYAVCGYSTTVFPLQLPLEHTVDLKRFARFDVQPCRPLTAVIRHTCKLWRHFMQPGEKDSKKIERKLGINLLSLSTPQRRIQILNQDPADEMASQFPA